MIAYEELVKMEDGFSEAMKDVEAYLEGIKSKAIISNKDGTKLAVYKYQALKPIADVVLIHGFSEFAAKYNEMIYYLITHNYNVHLVELRGHGYSERKVDDRCKVHVEDFKEYLSDVETLLDYMGPKVRPLYLIGHSMGGGISAYFLETHPGIFDKAVLSSPMICLKTGRLSIKMTKSASDIYDHLGKSEEYGPSNGPFTSIPHFEGSSCASKARYDYTFGLRLSNEMYQTWGATYSWIHAASLIPERVNVSEQGRKITCPTLVMSAGHDHLILVKYAMLFAAKVRDIKYVYFENARHEIFNSEVNERVAFYQELFNFLS